MSQTDIHKICILGAGELGNYIALESALAGCEVKVYDTSTAAVASASIVLQHWASAMIERGWITDQQAAAAIKFIKPTSDPVEAAANADLLSESVYERIEVKKSVLKTFAELVPRHCILTTNTSVIRPSEIELALSDGSRFAALHFNQLTKFVDLVPGPRTASHTMRLLENFLVRLNKIWATPIKEKAGYICNNLSDSITIAAFHLWYQKTAVFDEIEQAGIQRFQEYGCSLLSGPLSRVDDVGLNIFQDGFKIATEHYNRQVLEQSGRVAFNKAVATLLDELIDQGRLGKRSGQGIFEYQNGDRSKPRVNEVKTTDSSLAKPLLSALFTESLALFTMGHYDYRDIDRCWMVINDAHIGPFGLMDQQGLKSVFQQLLGYSRHLNSSFGSEDPETLQARLAIQHLKKKILDEKLGKDCGQGFYNYPNPEFEDRQFLEMEDPQQGHVQEEHQLEPGLGAFVICNVYKEQIEANQPGEYFGKFVILLEAPGTTASDHIEHITVTGPDDYCYQMNTSSIFGDKEANGMVHQKNIGIWFQAFDYRGLLLDGTYTVELKYKSGKTYWKRKSFSCNTQLLDQYLAMEKDFNPSGRLSPIPKILELSWNTIPGVDAYYCVRLADDSNGLISPLTHSPLVFDNIFGKGDDIEGGLNKNHLRTSAKLLPRQSYIWFTEILDSNNLENITIAIFQQEQLLYT